METMKEERLFWSRQKMRVQNNAKFKYVLAILSIVVILVILSAILYSCQMQTTANNVFYKVASSIVEVKATQGTTSESFGTAVFMDESGRMITNSHVVTFKKNSEITEYDEVWIRLPSEDDYRVAHVEKFDDEMDLAVLCPEDVDFSFTPIETADSNKVDYGDKVYAVGNAMNYGISISEGIISSPLIDVEYSGITQTVIQADVVISAGSSGGALLDRKGRLIGLTTFRLKDNEGNVVYGTAYSIPVNEIMEYVFRS